jgi:hypothetical protein
MPRKLFITALLACYLFYVQGCTSRQFIPVEDLPTRGEQKSLTVEIAIEKIDGEVLKIDSWTGSVLFVQDTLQVKFSKKDPVILIPLADVKQVTVEKLAVTRTVLCGVGIVFLGTVFIYAMLHGAEGM